MKGVTVWLSFDEGAPDCSTAVNPRSVLRAKPVGPDLLEYDKQAAHKASIKLDAGDVRGAVRFLSSDDRFVTPNLDTFDFLLSKHPPVPHDRRPTPVVKTGRYSCTVLELIKAIKSFAVSNQLQSVCNQLRAGMATSCARIREDRFIRQPL